MKEMIMQWVDNVQRYGYYREVRDSLGCIHFENDRADFESEAEFNNDMSAQIAFSDRHIITMG